MRWWLCGALATVLLIVIGVPVYIHRHPGPCRDSVTFMRLNDDGDNTTCSPDQKLTDEPTKPNGTLVYCTCIRK